MTDSLLLVTIDEKALGYQTVIGCVNKPSEGSVYAVVDSFE